MKKSISVWTDGGSRNHGNIKGGHVKPSDSAAWAFLIKYPNGVTLHRSGYRKGATNNQMELQGVISALATLTNDGFCTLKAPMINLYTDSKYIYNAFAKKWINNWRNKKFKGIKNASEWKFLLILISHIALIHFHWVKGHATNKGNIFVDHLLNKKMDQIEQQIKDKNKSKE